MMTMTITELSNKWNSISPISKGFLLASDENQVQSFHIGYSNNMQKCFMVLNTPKFDNLVSSKAIQVDCVKLLNNSYALRFTLNHPSLDDIFIKLCWDLIECSKGTENPSEKILIQYDMWLRLLKKINNELLSPSVQNGLVGELLYLSSSIDLYGDDTAITAWTGPDGSDQDFDFEDHWSEIKAVSISADSVKISSLQQLDREDIGFLTVYFMDKTTSKGSQTISLTELVESLRNKISSPKALDMFNCKLTKIGYLDSDSDKYQDIRYRLSEERTYEVCSKFPRLTRNNVPIEITSSEYHINLAMINSFKV